MLTCNIDIGRGSVNNVKVRKKVIQKHLEASRVGINNSIEGIT